MSQKNGGFMDSKGIHFEKPRPTNPYKTWDPDKERGFGGLFSICGEILFPIQNQDYYSCYTTGFFFDGPNKAIKAPKAPFTHRLGATTAPAVAADINIYQDQNYAD